MNGRGGKGWLAAPAGTRFGMDDKLDDLKGRAKEAAGDVTDNPDLKREGKTDQLGAQVKDKVEGAVDKVKGLINKDR